MLSGYQIKCFIRYLFHWRYIVACIALYLSLLSYTRGQTGPDRAQSLFQPGDPVIQLWANNFTESVTQKPYVTVVMFYAAWCGHCRRSAPVYKAFAENIQGWSQVVRAAAVSCSDLFNQDLCRNYGVQGYPTFKYFPANAESSFLGTLASDIQGGADATHDLRSVTLEYLQQQLNLAKTDRSWPPLAVASTIAEIQPNSGGQMFVIVEDQNMLSNHIGLAIILDTLSSLPSIKIRRIELRNTQLPSSGLYIYTSGGFQQLSTSSVEKSLLRDIRNHSGSNTGTFRSSYGPYQTTIAPRSWVTYNPQTYRPKGVHMRDLESAIYRSLWLEVAAQDVIEAEKLQALKNYIQLLDQYYPGEEHVRRYLQKLNSWIATQSNPIHHDEWTNKLNSLQSREAFISQNESYTGCAGSNPRLRGYTCGLWMMFHALTVNAYRLQRSNASFHPLTVLHPIRDYIHHFFACRECATHFGEMASTMDTEVLQIRDVILWLWRAHNKVNRRLHGVVDTEDPQEPKIQFPPQAACRRCYRSSVIGSVDPFNVNDSDWSLDDVIDYLMDYYSQNKIIDDHDESAEASALSPRPSRTLSGEACRKLSTSWTACSKTCDVGFSTRMITENTDGACKLVMETRWCILRPCNIRLSDWSTSAWHVDNCPRIAHTYRLSKPRTLTYGNCTTVRSESWRICGLCPRTRRGRMICCRPAHSITRQVEVTCIASEAESSSSLVSSSVEARGIVNVEEIQHCVCDEDCSNLAP